MDAAPPSSRPPRAAGWRPLVGLMLLGYGTLVLAGVLPHDAVLAGALSLAAGIGFLAAGLPSAGTPRARLTALMGCACVGGVSGYALATGSGLSMPELAILAYGALLAAASLRLDGHVFGVRVASLVGWSFPLVLAPFAVFAVNASLSTAETGAAAAPVVQLLVVEPTAAALRLSGTPVELAGSTMLLATPRGTLALGVGLVCAGLYPAILFGGLVGVHVWMDRVPVRRAAAIAAAGLASLWLLNIVRLVVLTRVGVAYGMDALQAAHAHLGWILFAAFMAVFWRLALAPRDRTAAVAAQGIRP